MDWLLVWLISAIVTGVIAQTKGRGGFRWFFVGVILGPVGVLLALGQDITDAEERRRARDGGTSKLYRLCPACAEIIGRSATICPVCKQSIPPLE